MKKISEVDFDFLRRLSSLYEALSYSTTDPVTITERWEGSRRQPIPIGMFYDAYGDGDTEDLRIAEDIMKKRIFIAGDDIRRHHKYHAEFLKLFYDIDEWVNTNNRQKVAEVSRNLCERVKDYVFSVVEPHTLKFGEECFLCFPSCKKDYAFHILGSAWIGRLEFNPQQTSFGAESYLKRMVELSRNFAVSKTRIPAAKVASQEDSGEGIMDTSLRGRHELNKELLGRIGFKIEE